MPSSHRRWICCQLGSREHYAIPRVLHREGLLDLLVTDFWVRKPRFFEASRVTALRKLAERRHEELRAAPVHDLGFNRVLFDLNARRNHWSSWETTIRRNDWFQEKFLERFRQNRKALEKQEPGVFFAYSYGARRLLRFFRELGWTTVLGQIDPAIEEENLVAREIDRNPDLATGWERAPERYWQEWREEIEWSDWVMVNSSWSQQALITTGVPQEKIKVVPLAYERAAAPTPRQYPPRFSEERPLRVLFLGQINLRKGARILFEAVERLRDRPIEFWMVGPTDLQIPARYRDSRRFRWIGPVSRSEANRYYAEADVFLLPTLSDGFALTLLEAQARGLPLISSRFCGDVVEDGTNGLLLDPLTGEKLAELLESLSRNPDTLAAMAQKSGIDERFSLDRLRSNLLELAKGKPPSATEQTVAKAQLE
jgi:glycosyltransferase involved in cell wall biosynthesis